MDDIFSQQLNDRGCLQEFISFTANWLLQFEDWLRLGRWGHDGLHRCKSEFEIFKFTKLDHKRKERWVRKEIMTWVFLNFWHIVYNRMDVQTPHWYLNISLEAIMKQVFILAMDLEGIINKFLTSEKLLKKEVLKTKRSSVFELNREVFGA